MEGGLQSAPRLGYPVGAHPRGQLDHVGEAGPVAKQPLRLAEPLAIAVALEGVLDLLFQDPPGAAELAQAVEVAEHGHVGVGRIVPVTRTAGITPRPFRRAHQRQQHPPHRLLRVAALSGDAHVLARISLRRRHAAGEERIASRRSRWREDVRRRAPEEPLNLFPGVTNRGRRRDDFRLHPPAIDLPGA